MQLLEHRIVISRLLLIIALVGVIPLVLGCVTDYDEVNQERLSKMILSRLSKYEETSLENLEQLTSLTLLNTRTSRYKHTVAWQEMIDEIKQDRQPRIIDLEPQIIEEIESSRNPLMTAYQYVIPDFDGDLAAYERIEGAVASRQAVLKQEHQAKQIAKRDADIRRREAMQRHNAEVIKRLADPNHPLQQLLRLEKEASERARRNMIAKGICPQCEGKGQIRVKAETCTRCTGTGLAPTYVNGQLTSRVCTTCAGSGDIGISVLSPARLVVVAANI